MKKTPNRTTEPDSAPAKPNLLHLLRKHTAADHKRLDDVISPASITDSVEAYSGYIDSFHRATCKALGLIGWDAIEALGLPDAEERKTRYERLGMDSDELGNPVPPPCAGGHSGGQLGLGALYVLEGSIHGGSVLMRMLQEKEMGGLPTGFLRGFGTDSHQMWSRFTDWFQSLDTAALDLQAITDEAKTAFRFFHDQFSNPNAENA